MIRNISQLIPSQRRFFNRPVSASTGGNCNILQNELKGFYSCNLIYSIFCTSVPLWIIEYLMYPHITVKQLTWIKTWTNHGFIRSEDSFTFSSRNDSTNGIKKNAIPFLFFLYSFNFNYLIDLSVSHTASMAAKESSCLPSWGKKKVVDSRKKGIEGKRWRGAVF